MILEVPCGNIESVESALIGGADRIELCSALPLGGLTPTLGMFEAVAEYKIPKFIMIRPREGDFVFSEKEFKSMLRDIEYFRKAGAHGIVSGILLENGEIDRERCHELIAASHPLPFTFHRAFDLTPDPFRSLNILLDLKVDRLLTSGQASDAYSGRELISKLVRHAGNKIVIMAGAGVNPANVVSICEATGVSEIHLSGRMRKKSQMLIHKTSVAMGNDKFDESFYEVTDSLIIKRIRDLIDKVYF
jgi:copper homeostasis protein